MIGLRHPSSSFNFRSVVGPFRCHHEAAVAGGFPTHYTLHNGAKIPSVALGVWQAGKGEFGPAVKNEREVGVELKESEVPRDRVWLTSKVLHAPEDVEPALDESLAKLGTDYLSFIVQNEHPTLNIPVKEIAAESGIMPAQVIISWHVQRGTVMLPKSVMRVLHCQH
uniref:NADP-dependent oxidoreductase domain-containing protein n=1 Tax=Moniliophthora roreri TaxID=221103 RepID=A0A0W0FQV3_MONRR